MNNKQKKEKIIYLTFTLISLFLISNYTFIDYNERTKESVSLLTQPQKLELQKLLLKVDNFTYNEPTLETISTITLTVDENQSFYDNTLPNFYISNDLTIKLVEYKSSHEHYWLAEVVTTENNGLKAEFASHTYGGKREVLSKMADRMGAILAINASGFYRDFNKPIGTIVRDGKLLQIEPNFKSEVLYTNSKGELNFINITDEQCLDQSNVINTFAFGPILVKDGLPTNIADYSRHPRTAIGQIDKNRYIIVVAEGRLKNIDGLTLSELQKIFLDLGCQTAYNLDGGGSSTLYFKGKIINQPSDGQERAIIDMIYF